MISFYTHSSKTIILPECPSPSDPRSRPTKNTPHHHLSPSRPSASSLHSPSSPNERPRFQHLEQFGRASRAAAESGAAQEPQSIIRALRAQRAVGPPRGKISFAGRAGRGSSRGAARAESPAAPSAGNHAFTGRSAPVPRGPSTAVDRYAVFARQPRPLVTGVGRRVPAGQQRDGQGALARWIPLLASGWIFKCARMLCLGSKVGIFTRGWDCSR